MIILETERLTLRRFRADDLEPLFELYRDPEVRRYYPDGTRSHAQTKLELEWFRLGHPQHPEPVSYTHLDVYKRQVHGQVAGLAADRGLRRPG